MARARFNAGRQIRNQRGPNVTPTEHRLVRQHVAACLRELSKSVYELPPLTAPLLVKTKRRGQRSFGGRGGVCIDLSQGDFYGGSFHEYRAFADDPVIGSARLSKADALLALCAHEVAHHVQCRYAGQMRPAWSAKMVKPHGEGWRMLYRWLRIALVNPTSD